MKIRCRYLNLFISYMFISHLYKGTLSFKIKLNMSQKLQFWNVASLDFSVINTIYKEYKGKN